MKLNFVQSLSTIVILAAVSNIVVGAPYQKRKSNISENGIGQDVGNEPLPARPTNQPNKNTNIVKDMIQKANHKWTEIREKGKQGITTVKANSQLFIGDKIHDFDIKKRLKQISFGKAANFIYNFTKQFKTLRTGETQERNPEDFILERVPAATYRYKDLQNNNVNTNNKYPSPKPAKRFQPKNQKRGTSKKRYNSNVPSTPKVADKNVGSQITPKVISQHDQEKERLQQNKPYTCNVELDFLGDVTIKSFKTPNKACCNSILEGDLKGACQRDGKTDDPCWASIKDDLSLFTDDESLVNDYDSEMTHTSSIDGSDGMMFEFVHYPTKDRLRAYFDNNCPIKNESNIL